MENLPKPYGSEGEERITESMERQSFGYNVDLQAAEEEVAEEGEGGGEREARFGGGDGT